MWDAQDTYSDIDRFLLSTNLWIGKEQMATATNSKYPLLGTHFVLDEEKILRENMSIFNQIMLIA